jgi:hypothetical protein
MIFPSLPKHIVPEIVQSTPTLLQQPSSSRREKKAFLESKPPPKHQPEENDEDKEMAKNDEELKELLSSGLLDFNKQETGGKEWRKHKVQKLLMKHDIKPVKLKMPVKCAIGMAQKKEIDRIKQLQEAKDSGMYHTSLKHLYQSTNKKNDIQAKNKKVQRGGVIKNPGKFKDGVLHINKNML